MLWINQRNVTDYDGSRHVEHDVHITRGDSGYLELVPVQNGEPYTPQESDTITLQVRAKPIKGDAETELLFNGLVTVENGGTGAQNADDARENLGIPDLTNIVKMETVNGTAATRIGSSGSTSTVSVTTAVTIPIPTDAIAYVHLTASATREYDGGSMAESLNANLIIDMTEKRKIVGSSDLVSIGNGSITISGQIFSYKPPSGSYGGLTNNSPLTYFVKYLTKVPQ